MNFFSSQHSPLTSHRRSPLLARFFSKLCLLSLCLCLYLFPPAASAAVTMQTGDKTTLSVGNNSEGSTSIQSNEKGHSMRVIPPKQEEINDFPSSVIITPEVYWNGMNPQVRPPRPPRPPHKPGSPHTKPDWRPGNPGWQHGKPGLRPTKPGQHQNKPRPNAESQRGQGARPLPPTHPQDLRGFSLIPSTPPIPQENSSPHSPVTPRAPSSPSQSKTPHSPMVPSASSPTAPHLPPHSQSAP